MEFNTYYINLDRDTTRNESTIQELDKTNLTYQRFPGIDGRSADKYQLMRDNIISPFFKAIGTDKMIGCGSSHIMLYRLLEKTDSNEIALVLEDDIIVDEPKLDYRNEIAKIVDECNIQTPDWDIIRLHSIFWGAGSAAAYIIRLKHIRKIASLKLHYHIDFQQNFQTKLVNRNGLFSTRDHLIQYKFPPYNVRGMGDSQKIGFYLGNQSGRLFDYTILYAHLVILGVVFLAVCTRCYTLSIAALIILVCHVHYSNINHISSLDASGAVPIPGVEK